MKFHDGTDLDAEAVRFSIERTMELGEGAAFIWDPIKSIETPDDLTVEFNLKYPAPLDLAASAGYGAYIMSPDCAGGQDADWFNEGNDCGSGPYEFESYDAGERVVLQAFEDYWGGWEDNQFETVILQVVEDPTARQQMIEAGDAQFTYEIPIDNIPALEGNPDARVVANPAFQNLIVFFNTRKDPLDNETVRQALAHTIPYDTFIDNVMGGYAEQSNGIIPAGMFGHSTGISQYDHDIDRASELLAQGGHDDGFDLELTHATGDQQQSQLAQLWKSELEQVNVNLKIRALSWEAQWDLAKSNPERAQDVFVMYWWPTYPTPYDFLFSMFHSEDEPFFNLSYYSNKEFDNTIDKANTLLGTERDAAEEMFVESQEMLYDDAPAVPVFDQQNLHFVRTEINGYEDNPAYPHVVFFYELSR